SSAATATPASSFVARATTISPPAMSSDTSFRVGLLGHGTVGSAFAELLPQHADRIEVITGLRPVLSGILTRSQGSFDELLAQSELIVELIGGIDPGREDGVRARRSGGHVGSANNPLLSHLGARSCAA